MAQGVKRYTLKNMIGGVSEQPPLQRLENQCEEMINCQPSLTEFLRRRNGVRFINDMLNINTEDVFVDFIERGDNDAGLVTVDKEGKVSVYNLNGELKGTAQNEYLISENPKQDIKLCTVRDYNFLLNTKKKVEAEKIENVTHQRTKHMVFIKQAQYDQEYTIKIGEKSFTYTTPKNDEHSYNLSVETIAEKLYSLIEASRTGDYIKVYRCTGTTIQEQVSNKNRTYYHAVQIGGDKDMTRYSCSCEISESSAGTDGGFSPYVINCTGILEPYYLWKDDLYSHTSELEALGKYPPHAASDDEWSKLLRSSIIEYTFANRGYEKWKYKYNNYKPRVLDETISTYTDKGIIIIETDTNRKQEVTTQDGMGNTMITSFTNQCYSISELPINAPEGFVLEVVGNTSTEKDDHYIQFVTENKLEKGKIGKGVWKEVAKEGHNKGFISSTMPLKLLIYSDKIELSTTDWDVRKAGDIETNPLPTFVGKTITDIFTYKNRLGFLSDDNVIFSETGELFNFFLTTMLTLLDSDPIDIAISGVKVAPLKYAINYAEGLFLYTDRSMYVLEFGEVLSTANVELKPILQFDSNITTEPVVCDTSIYYVGKKGETNRIREYKPTGNSDQYGYSNEITTQLTNYLKGNVCKMCVNLENGLMFLINRTNTIYAYTFFKDNLELLLSSWHKWTFKYEVLNAVFFREYLYLVFKKDDETLMLGRITISKNDSNFLDFYGADNSEEYISSYTYSPYFIRQQGMVIDIPTMIRTMTLKYNSDSEFKVIIERKNRKREERMFDNRRAFTRFLVASKNKDVKVTIESIKDKPFNIIETDYEVLYASRS